MFSSTRKPALSTRPPTSVMLLQRNCTRHACTGFSNAKFRISIKQKQLYLPCHPRWHSVPGISEWGGYIRAMRRTPTEQTLLLHGTSAPSAFRWSTGEVLYNLHQCYFSNWNEIRIKNTGRKTRNFASNFRSITAALCVWLCVECWCDN